MSHNKVRVFQRFFVACNFLHATRMQHGCNTDATRMQHGCDESLILFSCVYRKFDSGWTRGTDGISSRPDEGSAQADSRRPGFALQVESKAGSRNLDPTATDQCASPAGTETTAPQQYRSFSVWLYHWFPAVVSAIAIVRPETIIRWHRAGFRAYWHWRSRNHVGRPKVSAELRTLIGEMSQANL